MQPCSTDVRSYRPSVSNLVPPALGAAKWRFGPPEKRHFPSFSTTFLMIFCGFFGEPSRQGANWREFGPERRWCESKTGAIEAMHVRCVSHAMVLFFAECDSHSATGSLEPVRLWRIEATRGVIETAGAVETDGALWRLGEPVRLRRITRVNVEHTPVCSASCYLALNHTWF
jgi:hypothetical protein